MKTYIINCYQNPEGYHLDNALYKLCYETKTWDGKGNNTNNNSLNCSDNFPIEMISYINIYMLDCY